MPEIVIPAQGGNLITFISGMIQSPVMRLIISEGPEVVAIVEALAKSVNEATVPAGSSTAEEDLIKAAATMGTDSPAARLLLLVAKILHDLRVKSASPVAGLS